MSIMDFFKSAPSTDSGNSNNASSNPSNGETAKENLSDPNPATNKDGKMPGSDQTPVNPLDSYAKMFEDAAKNSGIQAPSFKLDEKVVDEVSSKLDFTSSIPQEVMEKAMAGDAKAFMAVIQHTSQQAYKAAIQHGTSLTDTFINNRSEYDQSRINEGVRGQLTSQALSDSPNFDHPVIKQELSRIANQYAKANPDASPQEVAKAAKKYWTDISSALNPASSQNSPKKDKEFDWDKYLNA